MNEDVKRYVEIGLQTKSVSQVAHELGIGYMNVYREAERLGISRRSQFKFTQEDDEYIRKWYGVMRAEEVARRLNVDVQAIYNRVRYLGCTRKSK